jgi:hypothetical protein
MLFLELLRRQEELRRLDELRSQEIDRRRNIMPMHRPDAYNNNQFVNNAFYQNQHGIPYNDFQQVGYPTVNPLMQQQPSGTAPIDAAYTTNQVARGYARTGGDDFQQHGFDRKRPRY